MGVKVLAGYGLTETSPVLTCNTPLENREGSVGKVVDGVSLKIEDGEIVAKGKNVFKGYLNNKKESNKVLKKNWFYTGDVGKIENDYLYITGRKKNMIISPSGLNVYPEDIEKTIDKQKGIKESVVLGINGGKKLVGVVLTKRKINVNDLLKKINSELESHQVLNDLIVWKEKDFPRTHTLKVKRRDVEAGLKSGNKKEKISEDDLINLVSEVCEVPISRIKDNVLLKGIGLDSLKRIALSVKIEEKFNTDFDEDQINDKTRLKDLKKLIQKNKSVKPESGINRVNGKLFNPLRYFLQWVFFALTSPLMKLKVRGSDNLNELRGKPFIIIANHVSMFDTIVIMRSLPIRLRTKLFVAGAKDFFFRKNNSRISFMDGRMLGLFGRLVLNAFAFSRDKEIKQGLKDFGSIINKGGSVLIYPEGTRSTSGKLLPFKDGIGLLAWNMEVPVVTMKLEGLHEILPKGKILPNKGNVTVKIGKPQKFKKTQSFIEIKEELEKRIKEL